MALWGNNDAVPYLYNGAVGGTVTVDYDNLIITGTGTTFGTAGFGTEGDVIRIGFRGTGGTYFGDATIVGVASTTQVTIASTIGLSGAAIANTSYWVSELPVWTPSDVRWSEDEDYADGAPSYHTIWTGTGSTSVGVGQSVVMISDETLEQAENRGILVNGIDGYTGQSDMYLDAVYGEIPIVSVGTAHFMTNGFSPAGFSTIYLFSGDDAGIPNPGASLTSGDGVIYSVWDITDWQGNDVKVTSVGDTYVGLGTTISAGINTNTLLTFEPWDLGILGLGGTIYTGISTAGIQTYQRPLGGKKGHIFGVSGAGATAADQTAYQVAASGWVGVTTYMGCEGEMRVRTETLVSMSGIETGPAGVAGTAGGAFPPSDD